MTTATTTRRKKVMPEMRVLPPRTYGPNAPARKRLFTKESVAHPAKANVLLMRDVFLRYTLPGQTILDPFGGIGSTLLGAVLDEPRNVLLVELEPHFTRLAQQNVEYIRCHTLLGVPLGDMRVFQGDSRRLPFRTAADGEQGGDVLAVITSPPFLNARSETTQSAGSRILADQRPGQSQALLAGRNPYGNSPGQIYNLPPGDVHAVVCSPPYGDVASRDRASEPNQAKAVEQFGDRYGHADPKRHVDGYGYSAGQIGNLRHEGVDGVLTSPPYADCLPDHHGEKGMRGGDSLLRAKKDYADYGDTAGQIGALPHDGVDGVLSSPPYAQAITPGGEPPPDSYASACLRVYAECHRVVRSGGILVLVVGNYVRAGELIDLAADTIKLAVAAGWTPIERWRHEKAQIGFWRRLHHQQAVKQSKESVVVWWEDILVFSKGEPAWAFRDLLPTTRAPVPLDNPKDENEGKPVEQLALSL